MSEQLITPQDMAAVVLARATESRNHGGSRGPGPDIQTIDWATFWSNDSTGQEFVIAPLFPAGRQTVIYAPAKTGKSLFVMSIMAAAATGRSVLGNQPQPRVRVLYLDMEMTLADVKERLTDMGYGEADDLSHFQYCLLPNLPPLDSEDGGRRLMELVRYHRSHIVVIDTMSRVVSGPEDASDTYRNFYRYTGMPLKDAGVALVRLDHTGKDVGRGPRGSSSKNDDPDVVFRLTASGPASLKLRREMTRVHWIPEELLVKRLNSPHLSFQASAGSGGLSDKTMELVKFLDDLAIPPSVSGDRACEILRGKGHSGSKRNVLDAQRYRMSRP